MFSVTPLRSLRLASDTTGCRSLVYFYCNWRQNCPRKVRIFSSSHSKLFPNSYQVLPAFHHILSLWHSPDMVKVLRENNFSHALLRPTASSFRCYSGELYRPSNNESWAATDETHLRPGFIFRTHRNFRSRLIYVLKAPICSTKMTQNAFWVSVHYCFLTH